MAAALPAATEAGKNKKAKAAKTSAATVPIESEISVSEKPEKSKGSKKSRSELTQKRPLATASDDEDGGVSLEQSERAQDAPVGKKAKKDRSKDKEQISKQTSTEAVNSGTLVLPLGLS